MTGPESLTDLELLQLDPRRDLDRFRDALSARLRAGIDCTALVRSLADRDPVALVELLVGPRAERSAAMVRLALGAAPTLEKSLAPNGLYRRLYELAEDSRSDVLDVAITRHPRAVWVVGLSRRVEGEGAGLRHLRFLDAPEDLFTVALAYGQAGHIRALCRVAEEDARLEMLWVLAALGRRELLAVAAGRLLDRNPSAPVVATLAATWGPGCEALVCRMIPEIRTASAAHALEPMLAHLPLARELLRAHLAHLTR